MAKQSINIGSSVNDPTADIIRDAFDKCNDNFDELYTAATHTVWVSKEGNDSNSGTTPSLPKLTFGAAITAASALVAGNEGCAIVCNDAGVYTEDLTLPDKITVVAPAATLVGEHTITGDASVIFKKYYPEASDTDQVFDLVSDSSLVHIYGEVLDLRGLSGTVGGVNGLSDGTSGGVISATFNQIFTGNNATVLVDKGAGGASHIHVRSRDIYLAGNNSRAVNVNSNSTEVFINVDHIIEVGTPTNTTALDFNGTASGTCWVTALQIQADIAWPDIGNGSLYVMCPDITGTKGGPATFDLSLLKTDSWTYSADQTLTFQQCYGGVIYVDAAATITLPPVQEGMSVTVLTVGDVAVSVDPDAADLIYLDGTALDDGDKLDNNSLAGDIAVLTYYSADGWYAVTNSWTDGGV